MKLGILAVGTLTMAIAFSINANAQSMWGTGVYGGAQGCGYQTSQGEGSSSYLDSIREDEKNIKDWTRDMQSKKREKKRLEEINKRSRADIESVVAGDFTETIFNHMENGYACKDYFPPPPTASEARGDDDNKPIQKAQSKEPIPLGGFQPQQWGRVCTGRGSVSSAVCQSPEYRADSGDKKSSVARCSKGLAQYRDGYRKAQQLQEEIDRLDESIKAARDSIKDNKQAMADEIRDRQSDTESGICVRCAAQASGYAYQRPGTDWGGVIGNIATGLLGMYAGYQTNKMVAQYNSNIGQATTPYPALGYGLPYINAGLYGAMGGSIGVGGFGCGGGGGMGMGGAFGYPGGMYGSPYGGGMYPGMAGMGMPAMGMAGGIYGGMGMPGMGMAGMGMPAMGMAGGIYGGMGMPGMGMAGMGMAGMGMPGMGMAGMGMPGMGMAGMGMAGMGMPGMGMPGMGMPGMGMPGMGMAGGIYGGMGMPGMGMAGMYPGMGMQMDGGLGSMQMQQQMMQMQMQQYQQYMQQYQSYQQQQMQKQQVLIGLQSELYGLMARIQQVQYGVGTAGYIGGSIGVGNGSITGGVITGGGGGLYPVSTPPTATTPLNSR